MDQDVSRVDQLLTASGQWNEEEVRASFIGIDADAILKIPVRGQGEDVWAWEPEKHGLYSVKSAYKLLYTKRQREEDAGSVGASKDDTWKRIWKLDVPPKVRVFWWRVIHEFLPAKYVLHRRHVEPVANCDTCGAEEETIKHVLMDCTTAKIFWEQAKGITGVKLPSLHPMTWARDLLFLGTARERVVIIYGMWSLWMLRNRRRHGEAGLPIRQAVLWVRDTAFDLWQLLHPVKQAAAREQQPRWSRPDEGWLKCNVDAAFRSESGRGASGVILRDARGVFLGAQAQAYGHCMDALTAEALACRDGLILAERLGATRLCLETDCQELVNLEEYGRKPVGDSTDTHGDTREEPRHFSFLRTSRICNSVAHELAKQASGELQTVVWHETPLCIHSSLEADCDQVH